MRASELLLIVRAQNQASGALRRIAADMKGLSAGEGLRRRGQTLQIARQNLMTQRQGLKNQLESITAGQRALALQKAQAQAVLTESRARLTSAGVAQSQRRLEERAIGQQVRLNRLQRGLPGMRGAIRVDQLALIEKAKMGLATLSREEEILAERAGVAAGAISKQALALKELEAREAGLAARQAEINSRLATVGNRFRVNTQDIKENNKAMRAIPWGHVSTGGRMLQHTARIMEYSGLVLGGTLAVMANSAVKFGTSVTLAATQTRRIGHSFAETGKNSEYLQKSIRGLMTQFPASADEMSKAAYDIYSSLNVSLPQGVRLLKVFNQAAVAGQTSLDEVAQAGITVMNDFKLKPEQMTKSFQKLFASVRFGRMTFQQFASMMPQLAPAFSAAGFGIDEMAKAAAFATRVIPKFGTASAGLARLTEMFGRKDFVAGAKKAGVSITDMHNRLLPLPTIIDRLAKKFPEIGKAIKAGKGDVALQNFFKTITALGSGKAGTLGTIQARRMFTFFVTQAKLAHTVYGQVGRDQDEFTNALKAMEKTTGVRWGTFINQLKALALAIGADVVPALMELSGPIKEVVQWWEKLSDSTKKSAARFATFTAAFLLVGGALSFILGTFLRLFATMGKFTGLGGAMIGSIFLIAAAVTALSGDLHGLADILNTIVGFSFSSFQNGAIAFGLMSVAAVKLSRSLSGVAATQAGMAGGGILGGLRLRGRDLKAGMQLSREAVKTQGLFKGLVSSAALLPGPLKIAAAAIGVGAGAAYLWHRHMERVRKDAEALARQREIVTTPRREMDVFQQLPGRVADVERARINIRMVRREIEELRKEASKAKGGRRLDLFDQIRLAQLDLADSYDVLTAANIKANVAFDAYGRGLAGFVVAQKQVGSAEKELADLRKKYAMTIGPDYERMALPALEKAEAKVREFTRQLQSQAAGLKGTFAGVVQQFQRMGSLPQKISKGAIQDMFNMTKRLGRPLTVPEMKAIIKAELDPAAKRSLPAALRRIFTGIKAQRIKVEVDAKEGKKAVADFTKQQKAVPKVFKFPEFTLPKTANVAKAAKDARKTAAKALAPITQKVIIKPSQSPERIGANIATGIQQGLNSVDLNVTINEHINKIIDTYDRVGEGHSPYMLFARKVGKPIVQGIALGILKQRGDIEAAAMATADLFAGTFLQEFESKMSDNKKLKITPGILTKDLQGQLAQLRKFNTAIARLTRRGVPKEMVDQLAQLGPEAADKLAILSKATDKELKRYVMIWNRTQKASKKSMRIMQADLKEGIKNLKKELVQNLKDMYNEMYETNLQNFGDIFAAPQFESMIGEGFKSAMADYNSQIADFQGQIKDLNQQLVDAQNEAAERLRDAIKQRADELQGQFGQLFGGDWLAGAEVATKIEWGQKLGFDDLQKDLEGQVTKFQRWRDDLKSLAAKVPPDLAKALEELGPEAVDKLDILNSATNEQLQQYVATWMQGQQAIAAVANQTTVDTSDITARVNDILAQIDEVTRKMGELQMPHQLTAQDIIDGLVNQQAEWDKYGILLQSLTDKKLPFELLQQLQKMGPAAIPYMEALNNATTDQLADLTKIWDKTHKSIEDTTLTMLNNNLKHWWEYGYKIVTNIIAGISSQGTKLSDYFEQIIISLLENVKFPEPPRVTGTDVNAQNQFIGIKADRNPYASTGGHQEDMSGTSGGTTVNMNVYAQQNESLQTTLDRAAFRINTKETY